ncbi:MAG TPA: YihY/virulence factor BrkB family protein [Gaiellaceae bacterium]|nr:YihY/virulence factor BrkB family protein [Gaiellaceae bacterium]
MRTTATFLKLLATRSVGTFLAAHSLDFAASIAYRVLFSLFPLAILLAGIFGLVGRATGVQADVVDTIVDQAPLTDEGRAELRRLLTAATRDLGAVGVLGALGVIWAASGMIAATRTAIQLAWARQEQRSFLRGKLLDVAFVFLAGVVVLLSLVLSVVFRAVERATDALLDWFGPAAAVASWLLGVALPAVLGFAVILLAYRILPPFRPALRRIVPAALFAAAGIALLQQLFVVYLRHFGRYDVIYGSLGAIIAFLLFVYLAAAVFLLGVHVSRCWPRALRDARAAAA